jgi:ABC-type uncharacterized transport system involved in gliding motility auxiliary subunit
MTRLETLVARLGRAGMIRLAIALSVVLFLAANVIVAHVGRSARADLTETRLWSLSEGTKQVLADLDEPLTFRLFLSEDLIRSAPQLAAYADRVRSTLETYAALSEGRIALEVIDPEPFSDAEDRAVGLGLSRIALAGSPEALFFGLAATNSTDGRALIPVFAPDREPFLEYDLTRLVAELGQPEKPVLAVLDAIGFAGARGREQQTLALLREIYDVRLIEGDVDAIPEGTRVVLAAHPQGLSDRTLYALDQWALSGGATMLFVDPYAESAAGGEPGMPPAEPSSTLDPLFAAWGVGFDPAKSVADPNAAIRTTRMVQGREVETPNPVWLAIRPEGMDRGDAALSQLSSLILTSAGAFPTAREDVTLTPLITGSAVAGLVDAAAAGDPWSDPRALAAALEPAAAPPVLAARLGGVLATAFPDGPPEGSTATAEHRAALEGTANVILVGDADLLTDRTWVRTRSILGQPVVEPFANNGDFVLNAVDQMAGGAALSDLRGRQVALRPFEQIEALEREAEARLLDTEQALIARIRDAEAKLREMAPAEGEGAPLSAETVQAVETFRADLLAARAELREVQYALRRDVERLQGWITAANVGLVPTAVAVGALALAFRRPRRPLPQRSAV